MDILQQLLNNELLNEDTRNSLRQAFSDIEQQIVESQTQRLEVEIKARLTEQFIAERDVLIEAVDAKLGNILETELNELRQSISEFRNLEVEYEQRLVEQKTQLATQLDKDLVALVHIVESFLDERIAAEMDELKTDLQEARKLNLGRRIIEAFREEFISLDDPSNELAVAVKETKAQLDEANNTATKAQAEVAKLKDANAKLAHSLKLNSLLGNLSGSKREVMESLLQDVAIDKLDQKYQSYLPRLVETVTDTKTDVIVEGTAPNVDNLVVKTGNPNNLSESEEHRNSSVLSEAEVQRLRRLAGIDHK